MIVTGPAFANEPEKAERYSAGPISKMQFISDQRAIFDKADEDFDGTLSQRELENAKIKYTRKGELEAFRSLDVDSSGYLSKQELLAGQKDFENYPVKVAERRKKSFLDLHDLDRNGTISEFEIKQFYEDYAEILTKKTIEDLENKFEKMDKDKTGAVSPDEYLTPLKKTKKETSDRTQSSLKYISRDKNSDGIIKRTENMEFVNKVFLIFDRDGNDELSLNEQKIILFSSIQLIEAERYYIGPESGVLQQCDQALLCT